MRTYRLIACVQIVAGVLGVVVSLSPLIASQLAPGVGIPSILLSLLSTAAALVSVLAGWHLLRGTPVGWYASVALQGLQVPAVSSGLLSFSFFAGVEALLTLWPRWGFHFGLGIGMSLSTAGDEVRVGINLVALFLLVQLLRLRPSSAPPPAA